jgi:hypothetical protein
LGIIFARTSYGATVVVDLCLGVKSLVGKVLRKSGK